MKFWKLTLVLAAPSFGKFGAAQNGDLNALPSGVIR